ncbi:MAG: hypothetical protein HKP61_11405 [Dactylosporangium sp.]|nr:hypothetical protein [Dactylosporangium sp.]NNJ61532.1 hypothetical protein [Dactylosporangium sp.]
MHSDWRCDSDGPVSPFHVPRHIDGKILDVARSRVLAAASRPVPLWCPWPLPASWLVTGVGWVGDDRSGVRAAVVACSGPGPVEHGPADVLIIAEEPGVGLGPRFAGIRGPDPGTGLTDEMRNTAAHAWVRAAGHPTPLWVVPSPEGRSAYVGEACGLWLYVISWPAAAGFVLAEDLLLHDLGESVPTQLRFGAPSPYLHGEA